MAAAVSPRLEALAVFLQPLGERQVFLDVGNQLLVVQSLKLLHEGRVLLAERLPLASKRLPVHGVVHALPMPAHSPRLGMRS